MKITQLRNATLHVEIADFRLIVDPMLAPAGALPRLKWLGSGGRRNPLVELPPVAERCLAGATHALITHCQRGHFDHLDRAGKRWLRERQLPVLCMPEDAAHLHARGLQVRVLETGATLLDGRLRITPVPCLHGEGWMGRLMAHGHGYLLEHPGQPSLYIAGDTVLSETVRGFVLQRQPDVCVIPAGGARFDLGGEIIMDLKQALTLGSLGRGLFVANHLEALDHCPTTRAELRAEAARRGLAERFLVPEDGQELVFTRPAAVAA